MSAEPRPQREPREWYGGLLGTARIVLDEKNDDPELMSGLLYPLAEGVIGLFEQLQIAHDALVKIAEGPSDVSPPEIARCALGWPAHGWENSVYEQLEAAEEARARLENTAARFEARAFRAKEQLEALGGLSHERELSDEDFRERVMDLFPARDSVE